MRSPDLSQPSSDTSGDFAGDPPSPADAGVSGISSSHAYLSGFSRLFPGLPAARVAIRQYTLHEKLGAGAMGVVYAATDGKLGRRVALKVVRATSDRHAEGRLQREAMNLARLSHPNIVQVFEVGKHHGEVFIAMEFVEGTSLRAWLKTKPPLKARLEVMIQAGRGVAAAHAKGVIHRDIKPDNILVGVDGQARVADFGMATGGLLDATTDPGHRAPGSAHGSMSMTLTYGAGTPGYMAPEQHTNGEVDRRSDVFAFCVVVWEAVYGERPFAGATSEELRAATLAGKLAAPRVRGVPGGLERLLRRGLAVRREERTADMASLVAELDRIVHPPSLAPWLVATAMVGAATALTYSLSKAPEVCEGAEEEVAAAWSTSEGAGLVEAAPSVRREATGRVVAALDAFAGELGGLRQKLCEQHARGLLTPRAYERAVACVDEGQRVLTAQASAVRAAKGGRLAVYAFEVEAAQGRLARCSDAEYQAAGVDPPDAAHAAALTEIAELRAHGEQDLVDGEFLAAADGFDEAVARARGVGYAPVLAAALYDAGRTHLRLRRGARAIAALREARLLADGARDPFLAADASLVLISAAVASDDLDGAEWYARETEALLRLTGRVGEATAGELGLAWVDLLARVGRDGEAETALQRAREALERHPPKGGLWRYTLPRLEARLALRRDRKGEAVAASERARAELEALTGREHPFYAEEHGHFLFKAGELEAAEASLVAARAVYADAIGADSLHVASVDVALARVYEAEGQTAEMVAAAERAERVLAREPDEPMTLADRVATASMLGRAAAEAGRFAEALARYEFGWRALAEARVPVEGDNLMRLASDAADVYVNVAELRNLAAANQAIAAALERLDGATSPDTEVLVRRIAVEVARETGDCVQATRHAEIAMKLLPTVSDRRTVAYAKFAAATVRAGDEAQRLFAESAEVFAELGETTDAEDVRSAARGVDGGFSRHCGRDRNPR